MAAVAAGGALSGCSHKAADAAPGVTPPAQLPNVAAPTTAPGHVSGAMRAGQQLRQMKSPR